jgi:ubiquinone biosynthesis monooxygenase Coq7
MTANTRKLPGDFSSHRKAAALRVDHAGEYGATRIYAGQLAVLKRHAVADELQHMAQQEAAHLAAFNHLLPAHGVRPSALLGLWHVAGFALGAGTALLGPRAAMACTVAVETAITEHYNHQLADPEIDAALKPTLQQFRDEEMEHHDRALAHDAAETPFYPALSTLIAFGCKAAIFLTSKL